MPRIRLIYVKDPSVSVCNQVNSNNGTVLTPALPTATTNRVEKQTDPPVTAVLSGYTLYVTQLPVTDFQ